MNKLVMTLLVVFCAGCATTGDRDLASSAFYGYKTEDFHYKDKSVFITALSDERTNRGQYRVLREALHLRLQTMGMVPVQKMSPNVDYVAVFDAEMDSHGDGAEKYFFVEFYPVVEGVIKGNEKVVDLTVRRTGMNTDLVAEGQAAFAEVFAEFPRNATYNVRKR